jgi:DNA-binding response OmpR family regulator
VAVCINEYEIFSFLSIDLTYQLRGIEYDGLDRSIDNRISRLRNKLNKAPKQPFKVRTIRGKGYLFCRDDNTLES